MSKMDFNRSMLNVALVNLFIELNVMGMDHLSPDEKDLKKQLEQHPHIRKIKDSALKKGRKQWLGG